MPRCMSTPGRNLPLRSPEVKTASRNPFSLTPHKPFLAPLFFLGGVPPGKSPLVARRQPDHTSLSSHKYLRSASVRRPSSDSTQTPFGKLPSPDHNPAKSKRRLHTRHYCRARPD